MKNNKKSLLQFQISNEMSSLVTQYCDRLKIGREMANDNEMKNSFPAISITCVCFFHTFRSGIEKKKQQTKRKNNFDYAVGARDAERFPLTCNVGTGHWVVGWGRCPTCCLQPQFRQLPLHMDRMCCVQCALTQRVYIIFMFIYKPR